MLEPDMYHLSKRHIHQNTFSNSQFNCCPLTWMFNSRTHNREINRLHERCICIFYSDKQSALSDLLEKDGFVFIHMSNIQYLNTEMFQVNRNLPQPIMNDIFTQKNNSRYNLRQFSEFSRPIVKSTYHGSEVLHFYNQKYGTCYQMIAKMQTIQILHIKFTLTISILRTKKCLEYSKGILGSIAVAYWYCFVTNK